MAITFALSRRWNADSARTASQVRSGSVTCRPTCFAHSWKSSGELVEAKSAGSAIFMEMSSPSSGAPPVVPADELRPHLGKYVAIVGAKVVASASGMRELVDLVKKQGIERAAYRYLPRHGFVG